MTKSNTNNKRVSRRNLRWFVLLYAVALIAATMLYLMSEAFSHLVISVFK